MKKKVLGICGIETTFNKDHTFRKYSSTFVNNLLTYRKDHKKTEAVEIIDCRGHVDADNPMESLMIDVESRGPVDVLIISCHSDWEGLYIFSKTRRELDFSARYIEEGFDWERFKFNSGGCIRLWGCQTAGKAGRLFDHSIAQTMSNGTGVTVYAFTSRSSQRQRPDGGFIMVPDNRRTVELRPERREYQSGGDHSGPGSSSEKDAVVLCPVRIHDRSIEMEQGLSSENIHRDQNADQEPEI